MIDDRRQSRLSIILVVDVLGISEMLAKGTREGTLDRTVDRTMDVLSPGIRGLVKPGTPDGGRLFKLRGSSEILVAWPAGDDGEAELASVFTRAAHYQMQLVLHGLFARGAVDVGLAYVDESVACGPPVIMAQELEANRAKYPRIILSDNMQSLACGHLGQTAAARPGSPASGLLLDFDGASFVDYLKLAIGGPCPVNKGDAGQTLLCHRRALERAIRSADTVVDVKQNLEWAVNYHNYAVSRHLGPKPELLIPQSTRMAKPREVCMQ